MSRVATGERSDPACDSLRIRQFMGIVIDRHSSKIMSQRPPFIQGRLLLGLLTIAFAFFLTGNARADVLSWLNQKIDGILSDGKRGPDVNPEFDRYLKMLTSPRTTESSARGASEPAGPYQPRLSEALKEIIPEGGDRETAFFYQNVYLLGVVTGQLGFRTPLRVVGHLGEGIEPTIGLLSKIADEFRKNPEGLSVGRLHRLVEKSMAQVQSTHQLMVESRELLESTLTHIRRFGDLLELLLGEEGRLQSLPIILGVSQTARKGADDLHASCSTLNSCVTHFRTAFSELRQELQSLDQLSASQPTGESDQKTLKNHPDHIRSFGNHVSTSLSAMREAAVVVRTNLGLIRLNHQALMQILTTLNASPLARNRVRDPGSLETNEGDDPVRSGIVLSRINPRLQEAVGRLAAAARDIEDRRGRLEQWALELKAFRPEPLVIENVPDWAFEENSIPRQNDRWDEFGLLPEREKDVEGILKTLGNDLRVGVSSEEAERRRCERVKLDEELGDVEPHTGKATRSPESSIDCTEPSTGVGRSPSVSSDGSARSATGITPSMTPYDLPNWF